MKIFTLLLIHNLIGKKIPRLCATFNNFLLVSVLNLILHDLHFQFLTNIIIFCSAFYKSIFHVNLLCAIVIEWLCAIFNNFFIAIYWVQWLICHHLLMSNYIFSSKESFLPLLIVGPIYIRWLKLCIAK